MQQDRRKTVVTAVLMMAGGTGGAFLFPAAMSPHSSDPAAVVVQSEPEMAPNLPTKEIPLQAPAGAFAVNRSDRESPLASAPREAADTTATHGHQGLPADAQTDARLESPPARSLPDLQPKPTPSEIANREPAPVRSLPHADPPLPVNPFAGTAQERQLAGYGAVAEQAAQNNQPPSVHESPIAIGSNLAHADSPTGLPPSSADRPARRTLGTLPPPRLHTDRPDAIAERLSPSLHTEGGSPDQGFLPDMVVGDDPAPLANRAPEATPQAGRFAVRSPIVDQHVADKPRTHVIKDGDTLPALAAVYLGDATLAGELYEANRAVVADPELLPIGERLIIPASHSGPLPGMRSAPRVVVPAPSPPAREEARTTPAALEPAPIKRKLVPLRRSAPVGTNTAKLD